MLMAIKPVKAPTVGVVKEKDKESRPEAKAGVGPEQHSGKAIAKRDIFTNGPEKGAIDDPPAENRCGGGGTSGGSCGGGARGGGCGGGPVQGGGGGCGGGGAGWRGGGGGGC